MKVANIVVFIAEDRPATRKYIEKVLNNGLRTKVLNDFNISLEIRPHLSINDFEMEVLERIKLTKENGELYLSIGILDLVKLNVSDAQSYGLQY